MKVLKYKEFNKGSLLGFLNLNIPKWGITINEIGVFQSNGRRWVSLPSRMYEVEGEKKYFPYICFDEKTHKDAFSDAVIKALDEFSSAQPIKESVEMELPF